MEQQPQQIPNQPVEPQPEQQIPVQPEQPVMMPKEKPPIFSILAMVIVLVAIGGYIALASFYDLWPFSYEEPVIEASPTPDGTTRTSGWQGYTEAEQSEVCDSYAGTYFNGGVITQEMGKKIVDAAESFLRKEVGEEFFRKHYKYKCDGFSSNFKHPTLTEVAFQIKVINEELGINIANTNIADADIISVSVGNETLGVAMSSILLKEEALQGENWVSRDDVVDAFKSQASDEFKQKIDGLGSNEITIMPFLRMYSPDQSLELYWSLILGQWHTDFCQLYSISVSDGEIAYEQNCSTAYDEPLMR